MRLRHPSASAAAVAAAVATSQEMMALQEELSQAVGAAQQAQQEGEAAKARLEQQVGRTGAVADSLGRRGQAWHALGGQILKRWKAFGEC